MNLKPIYHAVLSAVLFCTLAVWAGTLAAAESDAEWKVGLAREAITPESPMLMAGYAARKEPYKTIGSELFVKAMAFEDASGQRALLITADIIGYTARLTNAICRDIEQRTGLTRDQILLNASHTHSAPMLTQDNRFPIDTAMSGLIDDFAEDVMGKTVTVGIAALADLKPAKLSWSIGVAPFVMNRRLPTESGIKNRPNPRGYVDRSVPVLRATSPDGNARCVLFGVACHNTTATGRNDALNGDYAGFAQAYVERELPGAQAMFMIGCGGDAVPYPRGTLELARQHGQTLGIEVCRVLNETQRPIHGPLRTAYAEPALPLDPYRSRQDAEQLGAKYNHLRFSVGRAIAMFERGEPMPTQYKTPLAMWQFGTDLTLVGISGETVVDYACLTEEAIGPLGLWVAGYCNDVFGYLPSARVLAQGGYETKGLVRGGVGRFAREAEPVMVEAIKQLAAEVGRK